MTSFWKMPSTTDGRMSFGGRRKRRKGGKVIHVAFGNRRDPSQGSAPSQRGAAPSIPPPADAREPVTDLFTRGEVAKLLGVSETRLRSLDRAQIVSPSGRRGAQRAYTFQDLIALRATRELLSNRIRMRDVAR